MGKIYPLKSLHIYVTDKCNYWTVKNILNLPYANIFRIGCPAYTFQCGDGQCLPEYELCNAVVTCADKSDELEGLCGGGAVTNRTIVTPLTRVRGAYRHSPAECPFRCRNGRCRSTAVLCSGRDGCGDESDESGCSVCSKY